MALRPGTPPLEPLGPSHLTCSCQNRPDPRSSQQAPSCSDSRFALSFCHLSPVITPPSWPFCRLGAAFCLSPFLQSQGKDTGVRQAEALQRGTGHSRTQHSPALGETGASWKPLAQGRALKQLPPAGSTLRSLGERASQACLLCLRLFYQTPLLPAQPPPLPWLPPASLCPRCAPTLPPERPPPSTSSSHFL